MEEQCKKNCRAYNSFNSIASEHRIITANIKLSQRANKMKDRKCKPYDWATLQHDTKIRKELIITVKNCFSALINSDASSTSIINKIYTKFEKACKEAAYKVIPLKPKLKKRIPWETAEICQISIYTAQIAKLKDNTRIITQVYIDNFIKAQKSLEKSYDLTIKFKQLL